jgi:hypothetical protein
MGVGAKWFELGRFGRTLCQRMDATRIRDATSSKSDRPAAQGRGVCRTCCRRILYGDLWSDGALIATIRDDRPTGGGQYWALWRPKNAGAAFRAVASTRRACAESKAREAREALNLRASDRRSLAEKQYCQGARRSGSRPPPDGGAVKLTEMRSVRQSYQGIAAEANGPRRSTGRSFFSGSSAAASRGSSPAAKRRYVHLSAATSSERRSKLPHASFAGCDSRLRHHM